MTLKESAQALNRWHTIASYLAGDVGLADKLHNLVEQWIAEARADQHCKTAGRIADFAESQAVLTHEFLKSKAYGEITHYARTVGEEQP